MGRFGEEALGTLEQLRLPSAEAQSGVSAGKVADEFPEALHVPVDVLAKELAGARCLGSGAVGAVWRARQWQTRSVPYAHGGGSGIIGCANFGAAVKVFKGGAEGELEREVRMALRLNKLQLHRTVRTYAYTQLVPAAGREEAPRPACSQLPAEGPVLALVMERCSLGSLAAVVSRLAGRGPNPTAETIFPLSDLAEEFGGLVRDLEVINSSGITLQDVSGGNLLVHGDGTLKFADFGYAWGAEEADRKYLKYNTKPFASHLKALGREDPKGDLFACMLALSTLYVTLAGCPFDPFLLSRPMNISGTECQARLRQLLVGVPACFYYRRCSVKPQLDALPCVWYLGSWILLVMTVDLKPGLEDDPAGYRPDHATAASLLGQWGKLIRAIEEVVHSETVLQLIRGLQEALLSHSLWDVGGKKEFKDPQLRSLVLEWVRLVDPWLTHPSMAAWRQRTDGELFPEEAEAPPLGVRAAQHAAYLSTLWGDSQGVQFTMRRQAQEAAQAKAREKEEAFRQQVAAQRSVEQPAQRQPQPQPAAPAAAPAPVQQPPPAPAAAQQPPAAGLAQQQQSPARGAGAAQLAAGAPLELLGIKRKAARGLTAEFMGISQPPPPPQQEQQSSGASDCSGPARKALRFAGPQPLYAALPADQLPADPLEAAEWYSRQRGKSGQPVALIPGVPQEAGGRWSEFQKRVMEGCYRRNPGSFDSVETSVATAAYHGVAAALGYDSRGADLSSTAWASFRTYVGDRIALLRPPDWEAAAAARAAAVRAAGGGGGAGGASRAGCSSDAGESAFDEG